MPLGRDVSVEVTMRAGAGDAAIYWSNTWELDAGFSGLLTTPALVADAFADFHNRLLRSPFRVDHVVLSTYAPDSRPYDPDALYVKPYGINPGQLVGGNTDLPLTTTLHIRKQVGSGRLGHLLLRGALGEEDISSGSSGIAVLADPAGWQTKISTAWTQLQTDLGSGVVASLTSGKPTASLRREVLDLIVVGPSYKGLRTKRKSRKVATAIESLVSILGDGAVAVGEIAPLVGDVTTIIKALGSSNVPLLP